MKVVYMGTSEFAVPALQRLIDSKHEILAVITQPDKPGGRGKKLMPSPVKKLAVDSNLSLFQPINIKDSAAIDVVRGWSADIIVVVSYGQILPREIVEFPRLGCINVHASLLPRHRGAAPIQRALMMGDSSTGVTTMLMDEGLDTGDIILQVPVEIAEQMDHGQLETVLAEKGAELLIDTLAIIESGSIPRRKQDDNKANYASMLRRRDELINWQKDAKSIHNQIRALSPNPAAYTSFDGSRFKIFASRIVEGKSTGLAGQVIEISSKGFVVQTIQGSLEILEVQKEGKKRMPCRQFLQGFKLQTGNILGG